MKKSNHSFLKVIFFGLLLQVVTIQMTFAQSKAEQIDKLMSLYSEYDQFTGSLLVAQNGKIIYKKTGFVKGDELKIEKIIAENQ